MANANIESIQYVRVKDAKSGKFLTDPIPFVVDESNVIVDDGARTLEEKFAALSYALNSSTIGLSLVAYKNPTTKQPETTDSLYKLWFILDNIET